MEKYWKIIADGFTGYWSYLINELLYPSWHNYFYWLAGLSLFCRACSTPERSLRGVFNPKALERLKFPRRRLTLELTENAVMEDFKTVERNLNVLVEAGIEFAIDDFGAGYSNLSYLARFPFNYLKVDRRLAENITSSAKDRIVLNGIVTLARGLELRVIMEGIETAEQLAFAERIGVPEAQGYLFAEPLSGERLIPFLSAHSAKNKPAKRRKAAA